MHHGVRVFHIETVRFTMVRYDVHDSVIRFFRPVFSTAATKFLSSHEFIVDRSMGTCFGKIAWTCGQRYPLKPLVSTVLKTTGISKTLAAFERATLLLMIDWRSKFETPKSIWGWRSISVTTQLSGVSSPFSLRFARPLF